MTKRKLKVVADVQQLVAEHRPITFRNLCVAWPRRHGTKGNVVTWPWRIIGQALIELQQRGTIVVQHALDVGNVEPHDLKVVHCRRCGEPTRLPTRATLAKEISFAMRATTASLPCSVTEILQSPL